MISEKKQNPASKECINAPRATLWIIKCQNYLSILFHSRILASMSMFYFPIMATGYALRFMYEYEVFSKGVVIGLLWIGIAPLLIQMAFRFANNFFINHRNIFQDEKSWEKIWHKEIRRFQSSKYLFFGLPWAITTSIIILFTIFDKSVLPIRIWSFVSFFLLFFVSSIGFYGIYVLVTMLQNIPSSEINFNPYHPDRYGGLSDLGKFSVKIAIFFSTGALVFPLAIEVAGTITEGTNILCIVAYCLIGFYVFAIFAAFLLPIFQLKNITDPVKERIIIDSRAKLDKMLSEFSTNKDLNLKQAIEIIMHYYCNYLKLFELKVYPLNFKIVSQFGLSFVLPILVTILQIYLK